MIKPALFLGLMVISFNVCAVSINELKSALSVKINQKAVQPSTQALYAGQDLLNHKKWDAFTENNSVMVG